jgi:hypothetical protein
MNATPTIVFFDNQIIDYLYQLLLFPAPSLTIPITEQNAILQIWGSTHVIPATTSALYSEVEFKRGTESPAILAKIRNKVQILSALPRRSSTAILYGEGLYGEGRYGMPPEYDRLLSLFKDPNSQNAQRDAQHIINCHDNSIHYLITLDKEMLKIAQTTEVATLDVRILKPSEFLTVI